MGDKSLTSRVNAGSSGIDSPAESGRGVPKDSLQGYAVPSPSPANVGEMIIYGPQGEIIQSQDGGGGYTFHRPSDSAWKNWRRYEHPTE